MTEADNSDPSDPGAPLWNVLGVACNRDLSVIEAAYKAKLRTVNPEDDSVGFQKLRAAYEAARNWASREPDLPQPEPPEVAGYFNRLIAHRCAGDTVGAIAVIEEAIRAHPPGSAILDSLNHRLLKNVALDLRLSARLLRYLADRLEWRDATSSFARIEPEHHGRILNRLEAEDFIATLRRQAEAPEGLVPALCLAPFGTFSRLLPPGGLTEQQQDQVRYVFSHILRRLDFIAGRFDARSLAALRQVIEGEPLVSLPHTPPPVQKKEPSKVLGMLFAVLVGVIIFLTLTLINGNIIRIGS